MLHTDPGVPTSRRVAQVSRPAGIGLLRSYVLLVLANTGGLLGLAMVWLVVLERDTTRMGSAAQVGPAAAAAAAHGLRTHLLVLFSVTGLVLLVQALAVYVPLIRRVSRAVHRQARSHERASERALVEERTAQLQAGLAMTEDDVAVANLAVRAAGTANPRMHVQILLADSSRAHLHQAASTHPDARVRAVDPRDPGPSEVVGCPVQTPARCPAVQQVRTLVFTSSQGLDACPRLAGRHLPLGPGDLPPGLSAVCAPLSFQGTSFGVLHCYGPRDQVPSTDQVDQVGTIAGAASTRIGLLRALSDSQMQASVDPLTGLLNRRALARQMARLGSAGEPYVIAMCDLDHFKTLNDTYGHETGDKALRAYSHVVRTSIRAQDIAARYGGEEFVLLLPGTDLVAATGLCQRLRENLARHLASGEIPVFTVSIGLADQSAGTDPEQVLAAADVALLDAKAAGRDQTVLAGAHPAPRSALLPAGRVG
ncbi:MAG: GGDEF domain-containing protein [Actinomycetes bacterium]